MLNVSVFSGTELLWIAHVNSWDILSACATDSATIAAHK